MTGLLRFIESWLERKKNATAAGNSPPPAPWLTDRARAALDAERK